MPTTKRRHAITESPSVAHALDVAARRWPGEPPARLLTRLIEAGAESVEKDDAAARHERDDAVAALTELADYYPDGYLDDVRAGWPE